jgi:DNA-binding Xre family transcriptional regulator
MDSQKRIARRRRGKAKRAVAARGEPGLEEQPRATPEEMLERLAQAAKLCREIQAMLRKEPGPELETIIQLHRLLVLKISTEAQGSPELLRVANLLMKPLMDWARLEETRKVRELAEQKYRDQAALEQAALEKNKAGKDQALRPETLEKIEHELRLF